MRRAAVVVAALLHALGVSCQQGPPAFNVTAISAKDQASRLECWQLDAEPDLSRAAVNYDLGDFKDGFVGILPPRTTSSDGTLSNAASVQYSLVMAGQVHVRTPNSGLAADKNEAWISGGRYGWLIAADTADIAKDGHVTEFPSDEKTIIAQFPLKGNKPPKHSILHTGPCKWEDFEGLDV